MVPVQLSSGDLVADRRADYAEMLFGEGDAAAAGDLLRDALALVPGWAAGWFRLGELRAAAGDLAGAADAWREALRLDPADRLGATLMLSLTGAAHAIEAPPSAFVETLFDQYADRFDGHLVERLAYRVPELVAEALAGAGRERFAKILDLGCGTGLMGERLRRLTGFLEGIDISREMLRKAEAKRLYDRLERADLQVLDPAGRNADLVAAADVFMYVGALERVFATVAAMLPSGGLFAFSVELNAGPEAVKLLPSRRYAHSRAYLAACLDAAGFDLVSTSQAAIRCDRGEALDGLVVVAARRSAVDPTAACPVPEEHPVEAAPPEFA